MRRISLATGIAALALLTAPAWAGRPLITEDAGVLEAGQCEIESYLARLHQPGLTLQWAQLGCGAGLHTQLTAGAGRELSSSGHMTVVAASGKTALRQLTGEQAGIAIAYATLGGNHIDHLRHEASEVKAVLTIPQDQWLLHANAGWVRNYAYHADKTIWALALERQHAFAAVDLMGEIFGDDRGTPFAQLAGRWTIIPARLVVDASWGAQINDIKTRQATIGLKLAF
jgi:hypothetical protein